MAQMCLRDHNHCSKIRVRDSAPTVSITNVNDAIISGTGDGFPSGSHAMTGNHPTKCTSGFLGEPLYGGIPTEPVDINQIHCSMDRAWKKPGSSSLYDSSPFADKTLPNPISHHAWKIDSADPKLDPNSFVKLSSKDYEESDSDSASARKFGFQDTGDISEEIATEVIGGEVGNQAGLADSADSESVAEDEQVGTERGVMGRLWDRSTVLVLALFVGLRLCYEAWFGETGVFLHMAEGDGNGIMD